jgi:hypothetical protein
LGTLEVLDTLASFLLDVVYGMVVFEHTIQRDQRLSDIEHWIGQLASNCNNHFDTPRSDFDHKRKRWRRGFCFCGRAIVGTGGNA